MSSSAGARRGVNGRAFFSRPQFVPDSLLEGSGFELAVPRCALIANSAALVAPPDSAVSGSSLNGRLTTAIGSGPATARLTRREDRLAQLGRGPENLVNRTAANYRSLNGSAASAVCPDRSSRVTKSSPPATLLGALGVRGCHSLEFGQDRHFLKVLDAKARPVDAGRCGARALDADRMGWRRDHTERLIGWVAGHGVDDLQIVHGRGDRHRRVPSSRKMANSRSL